MNELMPLLNLGVGGAIAMLVIVLWRQDRRGWIARYEEDRKRSEERYERLAEDFRTIVQDNTQALTRLVEHLAQGVVNCPMKPR